MEHIVGIGEYATSDNPEDVIKTFALSTCVGLVFYSASKKALGMAHIQLPDSSAIRSGDLPSRFADIAPEFLFTEMQRKYAVTKGELVVSLYGGISRNESDYFRIGEKNLDSVKAALKKMGFLYTDVDTGGNDSRTLVAYVASGIVEVIKRPMLLW